MEYIMTKTFFKIFIISILSLIYTFAFATGEYDGVWAGTGTLVVDKSTEGLTTATIVYQENADLLSIFDDVFGVIKLVRSGSQWKITSPLQTEVYGILVIFSEFTLTFQSNSSCTTHLTFTADGVPGTGNIIAKKKTCQNLSNNSVRLGLSGAMDSYSCYQTNLNKGATKLQIQTMEGVGDCDLNAIYHRPNNNLWEANYSGNDFNEENITIDRPSEGIWYTILYGYEAYSGLTLKLSYNESTRKVPVEVLKLLLLDD
jgi:hypothetical protein